MRDCQWVHRRHGIAGAYATRASIVFSVAPPRRGLVHEWHVHTRMTRLAGIPTPGLTSAAARAAKEGSFHEESTDPGGGDGYHAGGGRGLQHSEQPDEW